MLLSFWRFFRIAGKRRLEELDLHEELLHRRTCSESNRVELEEVIRLAKGSNPYAEGSGILSFAGKISRALQDSQDAFLRFVSEFVQIPSEAPKVGEASVAECQAWLKDRLESWGWDPSWIDFWEDGPNEPNLVVKIPGRSGKAQLMLNGHADVVPVPKEEVEKWRYDPYSGKIADGCLWGRGSSDMKGGVGAFLWAAKLLIDLGYDFEHDLILTINIGEESAKPDIGVNSVLRRGYGAPLVINAEPSNLQIFRAAMGWFFFDISVMGKGTHPANRYMCVDPSIPIEERPGADAIDKMRLIMNALTELNNAWSERDFSLAPLGSMNMTSVHITGGDLSAIMPVQCRTTYAVVYHPGYKSADVIQEIENCIKTVADGDEWLRVHPPVVRVPVLDPVWEPMLTDENHPGCDELEQAIRWVTGDKPQFGSFPGPCDANMIAAAGFDTLIFGPGDLSFGCHGINEFVPLEHLLKAAEVYAHMMFVRCCSDGHE